MSLILRALAAIALAAAIAGCAGFSPVASDSPGVYEDALSD
jgi:hypothetical protein